MSEFDFLAEDLNLAFRSRYRKIIRYQDAFDRIQAELKVFERDAIAHLNKSNPKVAPLKTRRCIDLANNLFRYCLDNRESEAVPYVLAAIDYLVSDKDLVGDFETRDGLKDDMIILQGVAKRFKLT